MKSIILGIVFLLFITNLKSQSNIDTVYLVADELPTLAMFEHIDDYEIRNDSSIRKMLELVYANIRYPQHCCVEGLVIISFIIEKDGSINDAKITKDFGCNAGEEALRIVKLLPKFSPAIKNNEVVRFKYSLPVRFRL